MRQNYTRVEHKGKPVRGLWKRGVRFYGRLTLEDEQGRKVVSWVDLECSTVPQAIANLAEKKVDRAKHRLKAKPQAPKLADYIATYRDRLELTGKKPDTITTESSHLSRWLEALGHLRLDRITPRHIRDVLQGVIKDGRSPRTANLCLVTLRSVFKDARRDGYLFPPLATDEVEWFKVTAKRRSLVTPEQIEVLLSKAGESKNGEGFTDYVRFLQYTGAREQEALKIRWQDVDIENQ
ncbi:MAG: phage integrase N-terminal SAM-like domain-containing protein, partial [Verrucomicrobia bacterium]|nr:phage integrase N-terminal SAM-like domain-containing protein [Verrucomicrobiota bacterium]